MKNILFYFIFYFIFFNSDICFGQELSKKEKKALKKELKAWKKDLNGFKIFLENKKKVEENKILEAQKGKQKIKDDTSFYVKSLITFDDFADVADRKQFILDSLLYIKEHWHKKNTHKKRNLSFKIQIAALQNHPIDQFKNLLPYFMIIKAKNKKELNKYLIGNFKTYHEAIAFLRFLEKRNTEMKGTIVGFKGNKEVKKLSFFQD
ncbi:MAG: hypothetical protein EAZ85_10900 [Bacteroidetes bacterium]|nr:MAG: hypothetical protein EAZ85_10900 [Bacteroidota bacterium]TAG95495.1 MAG: hypothetical protein EAZ20_00245 [Bacteroidota bacterium]